MKPWVHVLAMMVCWVAVGCSPAQVTRMGPPLPPRPAGCEVHILSPGQIPDRPYRDVGMVHVEHCPNYDSGSCRRWVTEAACELGGDVVYLDPSKRADFELQPVAFRLTVGAYQAEAGVLAARCEPACKDGQDCLGGLCVERRVAAPCDEPVVSDTDQGPTEDDPPERCLE